MAPSFDCVVSSLLCSEDNTIFDDNDYGVGVDEFQGGGARYHRNHRNHDQEKSFDGGDEGLPLQSDECLASMVENECHHMPGVDYFKRLRSGDLDLGARKEAVDWIGKVGVLV